MAKPRTSAKSAPAGSPAPVTAAAPAPHWLAIDLPAFAAALFCIALGYLSRLALNPDGVSYLDLAAAVQRGDWRHFVQGYWSPLFPFITGLISRLSGLAGSELVPVTHAINTIAAVVAVWILWRWGRAVASTRPLFGTLAIAAFLLCSAGLPRIEAVTPDVLLLLVAIGLGHELLMRSDQRWLRIGAWFGISFLVKTSTWPWLFIAVPLRLWAAPDASARRRVWWSTAVCAVVMLAWIAPLSIKAGRPTLGSSGRLNWSWYIDANTSRLPDGDKGTNRTYREASLGDGRQITVATFDDAEYWTYQPWGDPTAWSEKVISDVGRAPTPGELTSYWMRMFLRVFGLWLGPMIVATMLPGYLLHRRPGIWKELMTVQRDARTVMLLGLAGVLQFVAIHAEPRLLAPYGIMLALGAIWWITAATRVSRPGRELVVGALGIAVALVLAVPKAIEAVTSAARLTETTAKLDELKRRLGTTMSGMPPIAVVGPAAPVLSAAYWSGVRISMQIPPSSAELLGTLPPDQQAALLTSVFRGRVPLIWKTSNEGAVEMLIVPNP